MSRVETDMQLVTFARDMAPHSAGEKRLVPDDVAAGLLESGDISDMEDWPAMAPSDRQRPVLSVRRPSAAGGYRTKDRR